MTEIDHNTEAEAFDYRAEAELFSARGRKAGRRPMGYRRFARAAEAIRFAIEDMPPELLISTYMEVDEVRFNFGAIRQLYESVEYPLARRAAA
jgi:hypothetical protein